MEGGGVEGFVFEASRALGSRFVGEIGHLSFSSFGLEGFSLYGRGLL